MLDELRALSVAPFAERSAVVTVLGHRVGWLLSVLSLLGCAEPREPKPARAERSDAGQLAAAEAGTAVEMRDAEASSDDPTLPGPLTGVRVPPSAQYEAELAELVAYRRPPLAALSCPGLFIAGSCGDGKCSTEENRDICPADCVFHLVGAYNDLPICPAYMELALPSSSDEVVALVQRALREGKRVRAVGRRHSASHAICGDGIAIDMSKFSDPEQVRVEGGVAYAPAGMLLSTLGDLLRERFDAGLGFTHLGFRDVSLAGAIGTSAHGSSPLHNSSLSHRVEALTLVLWNGELRTFRSAETAPDTFRALTTHLGLFGVITEVGVRVDRAQNLDTVVDFVEESVVLDEGGPLLGVVGCDFAQYNWFPGHRKVVRWCGKLSDEPAVEADNTLLDPGVSADLSSLAKSGFHAGTCDKGLNALLEEVRLSGLQERPPIRVRDPDGSEQNVLRAVGALHRMTSAKLIELGEQKYFQMDWEVAIPGQYAADALRAARSVFDAHDVSLPGVGVFIRFARVERGSWLSYHSAGGNFAEGDTAMFFETPVAVPVGYSESELRDYLHIYESLVALFIRHFGARAHWGKNLDAVFDLERSVGTFEARVAKLNEVVAELDPYGVFANDFARRIGVVWPKEGQNPAPSVECACGLRSEPVCDVHNRQTYASTCSASCAGVTSNALVARPCAALQIDTCSLFDARTCVWERVAREREPGVAPLLLF